MKKFDLKLARAGHPVVTKSGIAVDKIVEFPAPTVYPLVVHLKGYDSIYQVYEDGTVGSFSSPYSGKDKHNYDLCMASGKRTVYVNIYGKGYRNVEVFDTKAEALENATNNMMGVIAKAVPVEVEVED